MTFHENHYLLVFIFLNISLLIKHLVEDKVFEEQLEKRIGKKIQLCGIFGIEQKNIGNKVILENYKNCARRN